MCSVAQPCPTLCDPVDYSPPGSSVHGILQVRILEWVAISFSRGEVTTAAKLLQSCLTLCDPVNCSQPGSSVHGILQVRVLEWVAIAFSQIKLDSLLKSSDITLLIKVHIVKPLAFPVVMYRCESWTFKKAECQRIDAFEFWCWRRLLRVPWTARRSNQSILKEISPEYSLEGLMLRLQYLDHLMQRADSLEKTLMLGKIKAGREGRNRERDG